jgi:hypothetical protein
MRINDVFFQNSNLYGTMNDCSGLWLFACFRNGCFIETLRVGFMLGFYEGVDYGLPSISGDPGKVTLRLEILTREGLHTYIDQRFGRNDLRHAIGSFGISVRDRLEIVQTGDNDLVWSFSDDSGEYGIRLNLQADAYHLYPALVLPNNFSNMVVAPAVDVSGEVTVKGEVYDVTGMGALDQNWSRKTLSHSAKPYGYSHYEPIFWNDAFTSVLYYIVTADGTVHLQELILSEDRGERVVLNRVAIEHLAFEDAGGTSSPTKYRVKAEGDAARVEYVADITRRERVATWGHPEMLLNTWVPEMPLISAQGAITKSSGGAAGKTEISGKGILEFILVDLDPSETNRSSS